MKRGLLGLSVREQGLPRQTTVALNVRAVSLWLESLPVANIGETARQVYQLLVDCNSQTLEPLERLKIMQGLVKITTHIGDALRKHYISQTVSLNEKQRKIAALAQAMQSEMAIGYKTVIEDSLSESQQKVSPQILAPAAYGAIHYLSLVLLRCYQLYSQQPNHLWHELHTLYLFAEQNQLLRSNGGDGETIEHAYMRIVLTSCANPYQLRQREIEQMFDALRDVGGRAELVDFSRDAGLYFIDLHSDAGPQNVALATTAPMPTWRTLALENMVLHLQEELRNASQVQIGAQRSALQQLGAPLLRHLVRAFGNLTTRAFSRTPANGTIKVAVGLSATHFLLTGEESENVETSELRRMSGSLRDATLVDEEIRGKGVPSRPGAPPADPFEKLYRMSATSDSVTGRGIDMAPSSGSFTTNAEVKYEFHVAALVNISPGGYCLALRGVIPNQTQTGEIIGLMETDNEGYPHWNIGTIRWMKRVPDAALQIGIQLIAPNARPVLTQVRSSQMASAAFQRSLLLPALKGIGQPATLITSPMPYALNQKVRVKDEERHYDVRLSKQVASSASFKQFQFDETVAQPEETNLANKNTRNEHDSFDNVWELI